MTEVGTKIADGSIFAGLTVDGKQQIFAMPRDLDETMNFYDAREQVEKLNAGRVLGHDDWKIPNLEQDRILQKNQDKGALKHTFTREAGRNSGFGASTCPDRYWSTTSGNDCTGGVCVVRFSDGSEGLGCMDFPRFSCRPVRLELVR
jgi:hypothetical protein